MSVLAPMVQYPSLTQASTSTEVIKPFMHSRNSSHPYPPASVPVPPLPTTITRFTQPSQSKPTDSDAPGYHASYIPPPTTIDNNEPPSHPYSPTQWQTANLPRVYREPASEGVSSVYNSESALAGRAEEFGNEKARYRRKEKE